MKKLKEYIQKRYEQAQQLILANALTRKEVYKEIIKEIERIENEEEK